MGFEMLDSIPVSLAQRDTVSGCALISLGAFLLADHQLVASGDPWMRNDTR